jgi:hypothetical protein
MFMSDSTAILIGIVRPPSLSGATRSVLGARDASLRTDAHDVFKKIAKDQAQADVPAKPHPKRE